MTSTSLTVVLQGLLAAVALICLLGSFTILKNGARLFTGEGQPLDPRMDNVLRYLGGMYLGLGVLCAWAAITADRQASAIYVVAVIVLCAALGRMFSRSNVGPPPKQYDRFMWVELAFGIAIAVTQYFGSGH